MNYEEEMKIINHFGEHTLQSDREHFSGRTWMREIQPFGKYSYYCDALVFEPGCRNSWHIHPIEQTLFVLQGRGWYVEEGKEPRELHVGDIVHIPANIRHWHGAAKDSYFEHIVTEDVTKEGFQWMEPVSDEEYEKLP